MVHGTKSTRNLHPFYLEATGKMLYREYDVLKRSAAYVYNNNLISVYNNNRSIILRSSIFNVPEELQSTVWIFWMLAGDDNSNSNFLC